MRLIVLQVDHGRVHSRALEQTDHAAGLDPTAASKNMLTPTASVILGARRTYPITKLPGEGTTRRPPIESTHAATT
jgi:hypothetical protein